MGCWFIPEQHWLYLYLQTDRVMVKNKITAVFSSEKIPVVVIIFLLVIYCGTNFIHRNWKVDMGPERGVIKWDVIFYYSYLPAVFVYHDLSLDFTDDPGFVNDDKFWYRETETGRKVIITGMGMAYLYSPFFIMAHLLAPAFHEARDGFQSIYQFFLVFSALFYLAIGFFCLWKLLSRYFPPGVTALSILLVGIGTNLYYYGTYEAAFSHAYSFSLISALFLVVARWYDRPDWKRSLLPGFLYGLIVLVRPSNAVLLVPLLFWEVGSIEQLRERMKLFGKSVPLLLVMIAAILLPWIPQFLYWHSVSGKFFYNSSSGVGSAFFVGNPHILDFLISYRKGWFVYTPVMLFTVFGFIPLYRMQRGLFYPLLIYLAAMIWVLSSWWSWWYGGSFGMRSMIDLYGLLSLPLAALLMAFREQFLRWRIMLALVLGFFVFLNIFQTCQYTKVLIHHVGMTKKSYWTIFLRAKDRYGYWQNLTEPDYDLARKGIYVFNPLLEGDQRLKNMPEDDARFMLTDEIRQDRRLAKDIRRYCKRTGTPRQEALDMVVDRIYDERVNK
jgi:hypothetical protein